MDIASLYSIFLDQPHIQTDTRKLEPGGIFFALKGERFNGNEFAAKALEQGVAYAVIDEAQYKVSDRCILVDDVLTALQQLALHHRKQFNIPFIAITGSNGKTTTKELILAVLKTKFKTYATEGNLNNHIGVPLTLLRIRPDAEMAIIEMGANHLREIASYCDIALPTHALITNCGKAHIEGFGSEEGVRKGKGELYDFIRENGGTIFRNVDLAYLEAMAQGITSQITYGAGDADYQGTPEMEDVFLSVHTSRQKIKTQLVGAYNFPNAMVAIAIGQHFGIALDQVSAAIEQYAPDNSRSQWLQKGSNKVILDAYNANPSSMKAAIQNFAAAKLEHKMLWIGAMKEMGASEQEEHRALTELIAQHQWDVVILVGKEFEAVKGDYRWYPDSVAAANDIRLEQPQHAAILIKGSRGSKMELLLEALS